VLNLRALEEDEEVALLSNPRLRLLSSKPHTPVIMASNSARRYVRLPKKQKEA